MKKILFLFYLISGLLTVAYSKDVSVHYLGTGATYWNLPDTGQPDSYDIGDYDDAMYQPADSQKWYTDNGDGTITDNRTGLMWLQNANDYNSGNTQTWEQALSGCESFEFPVGVYDDWRLPNVRELMSLLVQDEALYLESAPLISQPPFENTSRSTYWTSTSKVPESAFAMRVFFNYGYATSGVKTDGYSVRPVRGGP